MKIESWPEYLRRISGGQTQAQIAERIGIGRLSVCNWLHGKTRPKAETVIVVARVFDRPPTEAHRPTIERIRAGRSSSAHRRRICRPRISRPRCAADWWPCSSRASEDDGLVAVADDAVLAVP